MYTFAVFIIALAVTLALMPLLIRYSGQLGLVDKPNERKVHAVSIPRVGGIAMVIGAILPIVLWVPLEREVISLIVGIGVLTIFGVLDDRGDLDYRLKFVGQIIAASVVVVYGGVEIHVVPFLGMDPVSSWVSVPLTITVLVAVTNAINLADGLDGLAAGVTLLSLAGVVVLAYMANGTEVLLVSMTVMGVVVGFLRFNTYPARIFMGDSGSQFLGFTVCVLLVILTQITNPALNPSIPLFLIGLPIFDTMFVVCKRIYHGNSPFSPDMNHIHHQLLSLNFDHYEAVVIIYLVQALFVACGVLFQYQSDLFVVGIWVVVNVILAMILVWVGRVHWRMHESGSQSFFANWMAADIGRILAKFSLAILWIGIPLLLLAGPVLASDVDKDLGIAAGVLFLFLLLRLFFGSHMWFVSLRLILYVAAAFVVYLLNEYPPNLFSGSISVDYVYFGFIVVALVIGASSSRKDAFQVTPTDFLVILFMIGAAFLPQAHIGDEKIIVFVVKLIIMFYAVEYVLRNMKGWWNSITFASLWALGLVAVRGIIL